MRNGLAPILFGRPSWVPYGSTLAFDFTRGRGWTPNAVRPAAGMLTTTRASDAYADNTAGFWQGFTSGQPRITDKGLLVEEARTNSIRNNSMQGAVAGTPGTLPTNWFVANLRGLTQTVVGTGTSRGIEYVDVRFSGTTNATSTLNFFSEANSTIAAVAAQSWTHSVFVAIVGGSTANLTGLTINTAAYDAVPTYLSEVFTPVTIAGASETLARFTGTGSAPTSTAWIVPYIQLTFNNAVAIDITLRIGWPQLELGAFATSPIRTTSAAATRAADAIVASSFGWFTAGPGTIYLDGTALSTAVATTAAFQIDDGTNNNRIIAGLDGSGDSNGGTIITGGATQAQVFAVMAANNKEAFAFATNDAAMSLNGAAPATDATVTLPSGLTTARIGSNGATFFSGTIRRVAYFPTRLTNAQLQALTQ